MTSHATPNVDREMSSSHAYPCADGETLTNANPCADGEMLTNETPCANRELLESLETYCRGSDMLTSNDRFYSKYKGKFWGDTCGHGLADLGSLTQHVSEHIVDSIANTSDSHVIHTSQAGRHVSNQEPITDGEGKKQLRDTKPGMLNLCIKIFCTNNCRLVTDSDSYFFCDRFLSVVRRPSCVMRHQHLPY
ncbi:hypothetical protein DPMN_175401 [Dreissena polymorpha]|uniref:Uncharacterized protein n=1 Tax=Dreissena polymorpha TaxID=45954 RepID=A0A9D4E8Z9_DREPO|nr:hypothetical protein DPMN_175401 [Dreissena polymorpha]